MNATNDFCLVLPDKEDKLEKALSGWINQFRTNLNNVLKRQLKRDLRFAVLVPDAKTDTGFLDESFVVIIFMDGSFEKKTGWARLMTELTARIEQKKEIKLSENRIIKVILSESGLTLSSKYLRFFATEEFIDRSSEGDAIRLVPSNTIGYWSQLLDLSGIAVHNLNVQPGIFEPPEADDMIFLANTTAEQEPNRDIIRRELKQHGYAVEPDIDIRNISTEIKPYLEGILKKAKIAVHLFGNEYGEPYGDRKVSLPEYQMEVVSQFIQKLEDEKASQKGNLIRLIWISPEINPVDERQIALLNQIRQNIEKLMRTEIVQTPLELFKSILLKRLRQIREDELQSGSGVKAGRKTVYIIHDKRDEEAAGNLVDKFSAAGMNAVKIDFSAGQSNLINMHKENLVACDAALIIYGHSNRFWLSSKMKDLIKAPGFGRNIPIMAKGLMVQGQDKLKGVNLPEDMMLMEKEEALTPFIEKLKK